MGKTQKPKPASSGTIALLKWLLLPLIILIRLCFSAKVKAPLFGLGASGQLGKAIVYFTWKGIDVVRSHVVPSNPQTTNQTTQRDYMTDAVAMVHQAMARTPRPLDENDRTSYSTLAATKGKAMTWFNMAVKLCVDAAVAGFGMVIYTWGHMTDTDKDDFRPWLYQEEADGITIANGKFFLGTSPTALVLSEVAAIVANTDIQLVGGSGFSGLTAGVKYYWQFRPDTADPAEGCNSGIYYDTAT